MDLPPAGFTAGTDPAAIRTAFESLRRVVAEMPGSDGEVLLTADNMGLLALPTGAALFAVTGDVKTITAPSRDGMVIFIRAAQALTIWNVSNQLAGRVYTEDGNNLALKPNQSVMLKYSASSSAWQAIVSSVLTRVGALEQSLTNAVATTAALAPRLAQMPPSGNLLVNGNFDFFPKPSASVADGSNGPDAWVMLGESTKPDAIGFDQQGNSVDITGFGGGRTGIMQIIESRDCQALRGQQATLGFDLTGEGTYLVAVLEWTGTPDQVTWRGRDPIADWTSTNYTPGGYFSAAALLADYAQGNAADGLAFATFKVSKSCNNLLVLFAETIAGAGGTKWNLAGCSVYGGSEPRQFYPQPYVLERMRADRISRLPFGKA